MRIAIAGGGTAGHVNPAVALACALEGDDVLFVGTSRGAEARVVPQAGFRLETIEVRGFDRGRPATLLTVGPLAAKAAARARSILKRFRPDVVVGMGGYVALPVCLAAASLRVPVVVHEQNIVLGLANRVCRRFARRVAVSFEDTLADAGARGVATGNPVLPAISQMDRDAERKRGLERHDLDPARKTLLVFGGSQGARSLNEVVPGDVARWSDRRDVQVLHVTGRANADVIGRVGTTPADGLIYRGVEFVEHMAEAYALADLALCRGGATTVAELGAVGLPALIVPYPWHRDKQQLRHGEAMQSAGAALVILDAALTPERVAAESDALLSNPERLSAMTTAARSFGRRDAARRLAAVVREAA